MKKLIAFILFAALVGSLISWFRSPAQQQRPGNSNTTTARQPTDPPAETEADAQTVDEGTNPEPSESRPSPSEEVSNGPATHSQTDPETEPTPTTPRTTWPEGATTDPAPEGASDSPPASTPELEDLLAQGRELSGSGKLVEARRKLTRVYRKGEGDVERRARKLLDEINQQLVFDADKMTGGTIHEVKPGETLANIADRYGVNWRMIATINGIEDPGHLRVGQKLKVLTEQPRIVVDKSDFRLTLYIGDAYIKEYKVGLGKSGKTPTGTFTIATMLKKPTWYRPDGGVVEYGEEGHLLGDRWMGFKDKPHASGYGIHGTNDPSSIGTECSNGCIRMRNDDVRELFSFVTKGTRVTIQE